MPLYEYKCKNCGNTFEQLVFSLRRMPDLTAHPVTQKKHQDLCPLFHLGHLMEQVD